MTTDVTGPTGGAVESKGLKSGALGLASTVVIGVASTAPAYSLAATLGFVTFYVGLKAPAVMWLAFVPIGCIASAFFYLNRALQRSEIWYGYAAAALAAVIAGFENADPWRGRVWYLMAAGPFAFGWWRRLFDFRVQGYALAALGAATP